MENGEEKERGKKEKQPVGGIPRTGFTMLAVPQITTVRYNERLI
jgi:hypothetical protein